MGLMMNLHCLVSSETSHWENCFATNDIGGTLVHFFAIDSNPD